MKNRYPGTRPFKTEEKELFFGRTKDIDAIANLIRQKQITILQGKSGLGKSSLIQAGLLPQLETDYLIIPIRLNVYINEHSPLPLDTLHQVIDSKDRKNKFLSQISSPSPSLWKKLKYLYLSNKNIKGIVLLFDQFEELFTYPKSALEEFGQQLSNLLSGKIPSFFQQELEKIITENPDSISDEELDEIHEELPLKAVISIRSDRVGAIARMGQQIPNILQNNYILSPITRDKAIEAIVEPARLAQNGYDSPSFQFASDALEEILNYLAPKNNDYDSVELFHLQIICANIEQKVIQKEIGENQEKIEIQKDQLGDLGTLTQNYYDTQIAQLGDESTQRNARRLIEEGLILEDEEQRLAMDKKQILKQFEISEEALNKLVDTRLLRVEQNSRGGLSYEISHDTFVKPILKSKTRRLTQEAIVRKEVEFETEKKVRSERVKRNQIIGLIIIALISIFSFFLAKQNREINKINAELLNINNEITTAYEELSKYVKIEVDEQGDTIGVIVLIRSALKVLEEYNLKVELYKELVAELEKNIQSGTPNRNLLDRIEETKKEIELYRQTYLNLPQESDNTPLDSLLLTANKMVDSGRYSLAKTRYERIYETDSTNRFAEFGLVLSDYKEKEKRLLVIKENIELLNEKGQDKDAEILERLSNKLKLELDSLNNFEPIIDSVLAKLNGSLESEDTVYTHWIFNRIWEFKQKPQLKKVVNNFYHHLDSIGIVIDTLKISRISSNPKVDQDSIPNKDPIVSKKIEHIQSPISGIITQTNPIKDPKIIEYPNSSRGISKSLSKNDKSRSSSRNEKTSLNNIRLNISGILKEAKNYTEIGEWDSALIKFERVVELEPKNVTANLGIKEADTAIQRIPNLLNSANLNERNNVWTGARRNYKDVLLYSPRHKTALSLYRNVVPDSLMKYAAQHEKAYKWEDALKKYNRILLITSNQSEIDPTNVFALKKFKEISLIIGVEAEQKQDFDLAIKTYENLFAKIPKSEDAKEGLKRIVEAAEMLNRNNVSEKAYISILKEFPTDTVTIKNLAKFIIKHNTFDYGNLRDGQKYNPTLKILGDQFAVLKDTINAYSAYKLLIDMNPKLSYRLLESIVPFEIVLKHNPNYQLAIQGLSRVIYFDENLSYDALLTGNNASFYKSNNYQILFNIGDFYSTVKDENPTNKEAKLAKYKLECSELYKAIEQDTKDRSIKQRAREARKRAMNVKK